jgi:hypothetical protein
MEVKSWKFSLTDATGEVTVTTSIQRAFLMSQPKASGSSEPDFPSPQGMQGWLEREIADVTRAAELRIKDATRFVNAYARGEISADQAAERSYQYQNRWGDALPGVPRSAGLTDQQILERIDETRKPNFVERLMEKQTGSSGRKKGG